MTEVEQIFPGMSMFLEQMLAQIDAMQETKTGQIQKTIRILIQEARYESPATIDYNLRNGSPSIVLIFRARDKKNIFWAQKNKNQWVTGAITVGTPEEAKAATEHIQPYVQRMMGSAEEKFGNYYPKRIGRSKI